MNISKFLLIDAVLVIAAIPLLFFLSDSKRKSLLLRSSSKEELLRKASYKLPEKEKLKELEKLAKEKGSGIECDSIIGIWKFISIWKKDIDEEDPIFSSLLRVFSAKIEFKKDLLTKNSTELSVIASIQFGQFSICFSGSGYLKGKQPLLPFCLNLIELKAGSNSLLRRSLKEPEDKEKSFFAMIALEENDELLSARGQGGDVVIWMKD
ncbi:hypothetical protein [Prochlorococcus marinus]|uniref:Plastid lipid-associated protein/fibrillin conserved domain-containing protein n=1 Tax=Prochlorococcus marinus str. PAC1 TaxID=59924 RepID=A0A0A2C4E2_PROMR|nr:hypothetical protein [Prochlorococcus marinus]KGG21221.1 hypothetical protein EV03_0694 [Prochlorococcus marinus str. PAC1]